MRFPTRRFLTSLALVLSAAALLAPSAFAKPREVAYRCSEVDICLIDPDNPGAIVNLTDNGSKTFDEEPVWSPSGDRVAFVSHESGKDQNIFVMRPDAPGESINLATQLTHYAENGSISEVTWSPDGTRLAYEREQSAFRQIFVVAADGSTLTPLTIASPGEHPTWAPDGGKIAFSKGAEQVWTTNADGSNAIAPVANALGHDPAWSPDGTFIAYDHRNAQSGLWYDVNVAHLSGGTPTVIPANFAQWTFVTWSPNGAKLAYRSTAQDAVTMEYEGFIRIASRDGTENVPLPPKSAVNVYNHRPSWSPDGARVTFEGFSHPPLPNAFEVYVQSTDGAGQMQAITSGGGNSEPDWRPDPLRTPFVPVVTPSEGRAGTPPGGRKPTIVWFTKRIPITASGPIHMLIVSCGAPDCGASTRGTVPSASVPAGLSFRPATSSKKKPKQVVVGSGKLKLREGQRKPLLMYLNKAGKELLKQQGKLDIQATVKVTSTGQKPITSQKTIHVVLEKPKKKH
jgi:Tol biopolymer transport system component